MSSFINNHANEREIQNFSPKNIILEKLNFEFDVKEIYKSSSPEFSNINFDFIMAIVNNIKHAFETLNREEIIASLKQLMISIDKGSYDPTKCFEISGFFNFIVDSLKSILMISHCFHNDKYIIRLILNTIYISIYEVEHSRNLFLGTNIFEICTQIIQQESVDNIFIYALHILFIFNHIGSEFHDVIISYIQFPLLCQIFFDHLQTNLKTRRVPSNLASAYINGFGNFFADLCQYNLGSENLNNMISSLLFLFSTEIESSFKYAFLGFSRLIKQDLLSIQEFSEMDINSNLFEAINVSEPNDVEYSFDLLESLFQIGWMMIPDYEASRIMNLCVKWRGFKPEVSALNALYAAIHFQPEEYSLPLCNLVSIQEIIAFAKGAFRTKQQAILILIELYKKHNRNGVKVGSDIEFEKIIPFSCIFLDENIFKTITLALDFDNQIILSEVISLLLKLMDEFSKKGDNEIIERFKALLTVEKESIMSSLDSMDNENENLTQIMASFSQQLLKWLQH